MGGGTRRLSRSKSNPLSSTTANNSVETSNKTAPCALPPIEQPEPPKHFPFPNTPVDSDLLFECLISAFSIMCAALQYLHLYRSVWWLPHSYTSQAMNFYLIDGHLVIYIVIVLTRRLIYIVGCKALDKLLPLSVIQIRDYTCFRILLFSLICTVLLICSFYVMQNQAAHKILFLLYPVIVYLTLFGFQIRPFFELVSWCSNSRLPLHACSSNADDIRREVENLKTNFNDRMKQTVFSSLVNSYYGGLLPCSFAPAALHYDLYWTTQHILFIFLSSLVFTLAHVMSLRYTDILHRSALHLGFWQQLNPAESSMVMTKNDWREDLLWPPGIVVKYNKKMWRALGDCNSSRPGDRGFNNFYSTFILPSYVLAQVLAFHIFEVIYQLILLYNAVIWYKVVSITFLLFFNYYTLYKVCRDYLISYKIYREEKEIHQKVDYR